MARPLLSLRTGSCYSSEGFSKFTKPGSRWFTASNGRFISFLGHATVFVTLVSLFCYSMHVHECMVIWVH